MRGVAVFHGDMRKGGIRMNKCDIMLLLFTIAVFVLCMWSAYAIAISDLPDWFKFFLLR